MADSRGEEVRQSALALYSDGQKIWDPSDAWNVHKRTGIEAFAFRYCLEILSGAESVLNVGAGSDLYSWLPPCTINSDLYFEQVRRLPRAVVGDVGQLPFFSSTFDVIVCVGSVLNYASLLEALAEIHRCVRLGGHAIIHFESSNSFEHWFSKHWNRAITLVSTVNAGREDKIWVYSPRFVLGTLENLGFRIKKVSRFHIASAAAIRLGLKQNQAVKFAKLDPLLKLAASGADDLIILAEKAS